MKKFIICLILTGLCAVLFSAYARADSFLSRKDWRLNIDNRLGKASYEEDENNTKGEWDNIYYRLDLGLDNIKDSGQRVKLKADIGFFIAPRNTETWYISGAKYQTNHMDFEGVNPSIAAGYEFGKLDSTQKLSFVPLVGYGYKRIRFKRTDFNILNIITSRDVVSEIYDIHYIDLGYCAGYSIGKKWEIVSGFSYGYVLSNKADNSVLGKVNGSGGFLLGADLGLEYRLSGRNTISLGGFFELEHLDGGSKENVFWPDNDLSAYGVLVRYRIYWGR